MSQEINRIELRADRMGQLGGTYKVGKGILHAALTG